MYRNRFRLGTELPRPPSWNKGDLLLRGREGMEGDGGRRREGDGRGEGKQERLEEKGVEGVPVCIFTLFLE